MPSEGMFNLLGLHNSREPRKERYTSSVRVPEGNPGGTVGSTLKHQLEF